MELDLEWVIKQQPCLHRRRSNVVQRKLMDKASLELRQPDQQEGRVALRERCIQSAAGQQRIGGVSFGEARRCADIDRTDYEHRAVVLGTARSQDNRAKREQARGKQVLGR